ncbi:hypothetical protein F6Y03_03045 [Bacillus megaterium]|nr:hypothetical protein [Priestia megaterium]
MNSKEQKRLATTREQMENAKEQTDLSSELEQDLENLGLQRRMKQLELESKYLKTRTMNYFNSQHPFRVLFQHFSTFASEPPIYD